MKNLLLFGFLTIGTFLGFSNIDSSNSLTDQRNPINVSSCYKITIRYVDNLTPWNIQVIQETYTLSTLDEANQLKNSLMAPYDAINFSPNPPGMYWATVNESSLNNCFVVRSF